MPDPITAITGGSAILGAASANSAANAQEDAARRSANNQRKTTEQIVAKLQPYYTGGVTANNALMYEMGLGARPTIGGTAAAITNITDARGRVTGYSVGGQTFPTMEAAKAYANSNPTGGTPYAGFQATPGYQFALDQGNASINALAGAKGGLMSGATLQALQNNGIGMANQEYGNYFNRLAAIAGSGQNAAAQQGTAMTNGANAISQAQSDIGNARAAGTVGIANAFNGGVQNYLGYQQYQQGLTRPATGGMTYGSGSWARGMTGAQLVP